MESKYFKRKLVPCQKNSRILLDPEIEGVESYVESFGFEWTKIDGFIGKESMSHGHIFGRFLLPPDFFEGKLVCFIILLFELTKKILVSEFPISPKIFIF